MNPAAAFCCVCAGWLFRAAFLVQSETPAFELASSAICVLLGCGFLAVAAWVV